MPKKKEINALDIITYYMSYILENNCKPSSVYSFAKENKFEEAVFYNFFGSFEAVEKSIFKTFFDNTITVLEKSEDYETFDARNKLLSFYYTFFENLTANRSYVVATLDSNKMDLKKLTVLSNLKTSFTNYIRETLLSCSNCRRGLYLNKNMLPVVICTYSLKQKLLDA